MSGVIQSLEPGNMVAAIGRAVQAEADRLQEEVIVSAVTEFERRLRERVAQAALSIADFYSIEQDRQDIRILVRHSGAKS